LKTDFSKFRDEVSPGFIRKFRYLLWLLVANLIFLSNIPYPNVLKIYILRIFGAKVGQHVVIKPWVKIKFPWNLSLGDHVWLGEEVWIDNISKVTIQSHVCISQGAFLLTGNHNFSKAHFPLISNQITVEDGVWVCAKAIVTGGVTLGTHSVLSLGCIATKDLESYYIYGNFPLEKIKPRTITTHE
jgi:putative colanic acid biosynthesis acetyltransferase WcaF